MGAIADVSSALAAAASDGTPVRVRVPSGIYRALIEEYPGGHPELPTEPIRQLSTSWGVIDLVVDGSVDGITIDTASQHPG